VHKRITFLAALGGLAGLSACTSGQSAVVPPSTSVNVAAVSKLQFAVGTANIAGTPGLNTVVTFRAGTGLSATLVNTPKITGPIGFVVPTDPNTTGNTDSGTNIISGSPQVATGAASTVTTFGLQGGAFAYGFAPLNSDTTGSANFGAYALPFYVASTAANPPVSYVLGPGNAFVPNFRDGTLLGFPGYASGFTDFAATPVPGAYALSVNVPTSGTAIAPFTATATLASTALLPTFATPVFTSDGAGGGSITLTVPTGCTEALVYVTDTPAGGSAQSYTLETTTVGTQTLTLPDAIGTITAGTAGPTLTAKDTIAVYAVGFDYPAIEAAPIGKNPPQTPKIVGANGQADITTSAVATSTY
jgi:hypothetical protein